jgi:ectoine hydroxylase-related dioxygenase (phytanoyl-CoA dioxygenase family)
MKHEGNLFKDGFVLVRNAINKSIVNEIYSDITSSQKKVAKKLLVSLNHGLIKSGLAIEKNSIKYLKNPGVWFRSINKILQLHIFDFAQSITKTRLYIDDIELHQKSPGISGTPPHQDNFYFGLDLSKNVALTLYFALNNQEQKSGGLGFYPGSHKFQFKHNSSKVTAFSSGINVEDLSKFKLYSPSLKSGDLVIHHCNIVHTASKNLSKNTRSNVAVRLFPNNPKFNKSIQKQYLKHKNELK